MNKVLLCGIQKTGNTWVRFVIFNYFHILNHGATKTLTWEELQKPHLDRVKHGVDYEYTDGFPLVFHTHKSYDGHGIFDFDPDMPKYFAKFDKIVYIYRNPFDTCISYFWFMMNRTNDPFGDGITGEALEKIRKLEGFVEFYLPKWIYHVKTTKNLADLVFDYDCDYEFAFDSILWFILRDTPNKQILQQALEMSSFENIRTMSEEVGNIAGLGSPYLKGYFCRDGRSGQYKEVMSTELINYIRDECKKEGIEV